MAATIDIEADIFDAVADVLRDTYRGIWVTGEETDLPARFPAATLVQKDSSVDERMRTVNVENAANIMWEVNVYSNKAVGKKQEAKRIMQTIDGVLSSLNFTRTMCNPISNLQDATIYRIVARYKAKVDRNLNIYQN